MMNQIFRALAERDPRLPPLVGFLLIAFLCIEGWMFVLKKPYADYQRLSVSAQVLGQALNVRGGPSAEIDLLERENKRLADKLQGEVNLDRSGERVVVPLLEMLDQSARAAGLQLLSVHPGATRTVAGFDELSFDVVLTGAYLPVANWVLNLNEKLGHSMSVSEMDMRVGEGEGGLTVSIKLTMYLPSRAGAAK